MYFQTVKTANKDTLAEAIYKTAFEECFLYFKHNDGIDRSPRYLGKRNQGNPILMTTQKDYEEILDYLDSIYNVVMSHDFFKDSSIQFSLLSLYLKMVKSKNVRLFNSFLKYLCNSDKYIEVMGFKNDILPEYIYSLEDCDFRKKEEFNFLVA
jgi:hypothetical protein